MKLRSLISICLAVSVCCKEVTKTEDPVIEPTGTASGPPLLLITSIPEIVQPVEHQAPVNLLDTNGKPVTNIPAEKLTTGGNIEITTDVTPVTTILAVTTSVNIVPAVTTLVNIIPAVTPPVTIVHLTTVNNVKNSTDTTPVTLIPAVNITTGNNVENTTDVTPVITTVENNPKKLLSVENVPPVTDVTPVENIIPAVTPPVTIVHLTTVNNVKNSTDTTPVTLIPAVNLTTGNNVENTTDVTPVVTTVENNPKKLLSVENVPPVTLVAPVENVPIRKTVNITVGPTGTSPSSSPLVNLITNDPSKIGAPIPNASDVPNPIVAGEPKVIINVTNGKTVEPLNITLNSGLLDNTTVTGALQPGLNGRNVSNTGNELNTVLANAVGTNIQSQVSAGDNGNDARIGGSSLGRPPSTGLKPDPGSNQTNSVPYATSPLSTPVIGVVAGAAILIACVVGLIVYRRRNSTAVKNASKPFKSPTPDIESGELLNRFVTPRDPNMQDNFAAEYNYRQLPSIPASSGFPMMMTYNFPIAPTAAHVNRFSNSTTGDDYIRKLGQNSASIDVECLAVKDIFRFSDDEQSTAASTDSYTNHSSYYRDSLFGECYSGNASPIIPKQGNIMAAINKVAREKGDEVVSEEVRIVSQFSTYSNISEFDFK